MIRNPGVSSMRKYVFMNYGLIDLLTPINLSLFWSFGFILGMILILQIVSGIFMSFHYSYDTSFFSVGYLSREMEFGDFMRFLHSNGVSLFFLCLYIHVFRGIFYKSYYITPVWMSGILIFLVLIITSFLGYVLPWTQMSFWAATVITNLASAIPFIGVSILFILWGDFSVSLVTLNRFYSLHFITPFILLMLVITHIFFLHMTHSSSPLMMKSDGVKFHSFFSWKDIFLGFFLLMILLTVVLFTPFIFLEFDMFFISNPLLTPEHIVPEWYFLPFYAILRAIPSKLGGVIMMMMVFLFLSLKMFFFNQSSMENIKCFLLMIDWCFLFWVGMLPVIFPFDIVGKAVVSSFFISFFL